ncbi:Aste57867_15118 [Aphanomyces stellatus]|uniref:Aste57867_15118 protein n=1 Tax=Aphanomyces stellatus TaxID=120398 RepID=A0A485L3N9_9STRA|nr:hypothetical protein As57867_015062 [Aphanomyces stellatus]VFT91928.1 Aste57867_15118 [Aphanomyces stellatus]
MSQQRHGPFAAAGATLLVVLWLNMWGSVTYLRHSVTRPVQSLPPVTILDASIHDPQFHTTAVADMAVPEDGCRIQFVFAGAKYDYKKFPLLQTWLRFADPACAIELIRPDHPVLLAQLYPAERAMMDDISYVPILQADFMKLLVLYYFGGLVTDLDTEPRKPFPSEWTGPTTTLATCDVVLGVETNCFDDECVQGYVRKGQIQNWSMWARRRHSRFLGHLIEYVVDRYRNTTAFPPFDPHPPVQDVAGSGPITDFVALYGNLSRPHYDVNTTDDDHATTLQRDFKGVLRIQKANEEVCILGHDWTGSPIGTKVGCIDTLECLVVHRFEGSWRPQPRLRRQ